MKRVKGKEEMRYDREKNELEKFEGKMIKKWIPELKEQKERGEKQSNKKQRKRMEEIISKEKKRKESQPNVI